MSVSSGSCSQYAVNMQKSVIHQTSGFATMLCVLKKKNINKYDVALPKVQSDQISCCEAGLLFEEDPNPDLLFQYFFNFDTCSDTDYGHPIKSFFIEIQNFWAQADKLGK